MALTTGTIQKVDADRRLVFGWAYGAVSRDGAQVVDHSGDVIDAAALGDFEDAAYAYVLDSRDGSEMHVTKGVSRLVESVFVTPEKLAAMGLPGDATPTGWWVGFRIDDDAVLQKVRDGVLTMFSIGGLGEREEIPA